MIVQVLGENVGSGDNSMTYIHIKEDHTFVRSLSWSQIACVVTLCKQMNSELF